jgi:phosphate-selective porin OprO/OprP
MRAAAFGLLTLLSVTSASQAQAPPDLETRLRQLEEQNRKLQQQLEAVQRAQTTAPATVPAPSIDDSFRVQAIVEGILARKQEETKETEAAEKARKEKEGVVVGADTMKGCTFGWDPNVAGWVFATANRDFTFHPEARMQQDLVFFTQSPGTKPPAQLGDFEDGTFFRRLRIHFDGTAWEVVEYNMEFALENIQGNIVTMDEIFVGLTQIPLIGTIRVGHMRIPHGLEGDMISSSKAMQFLERSAMTDAIFENFNFAPGIWFGNNFLDQRMTYSAMMYRTEQNGNNGADFGDGEYAATGRLTFLPVYANEGRTLVHLGFSSTWQAAEKPGTELTGPNAIRLRARPELRDFQGGFTEFASAVNPGSGALPGNDSRMVDTGSVTAQDYLIQAGEFLAIMGPFSVQAEAAFGTLTNAVVPSGGVPGAKGVTVGNINTWGGYVAGSYFLTGENRLYDKRLGRLGTLYVRPATPFWVVQDENGGVNSGLGAWELVARYSYVNLNDGVVQGGVFQGLTAGINWYLNTNLKVQFNYITDQRWNRLNNGQFPGTGAVANPGNLSGTVQGFGMRVQFFF